MKSKKYIVTTERLQDILAEVAWEGNPIIVFPIRDTDNAWVVQQTEETGALCNYELYEN